MVDKPYNQNSVPQVFLADFCTSPNGIELYGDYLLVGCEDGIYRITIKNKDVVKVTDISNAITDIDGMYFDEKQEILYVVLLNDQIVALSSEDSWTTLDILYVFTAGCASGRPSTVTLAQSTLFTTCLGDMVGPYEIRYLKSVNDVVTNGNSVYGTSSTDGGDDDDDDSLKKSLRIAVFVLGCFCVVLIILVAASTNAMHNMHKARDEEKAVKKANSAGVSMNPMADDDSPNL